MRVLVCGGREYDNWSELSYILDKLNEDRPITTIIEGGAKGADFLARVWARYRNIRLEEYPANWKKHGKAAGSIRNQEMLDVGKPEMVVAFKGGYGTKDMIIKSCKAGVGVMRVEGDKAKFYDRG